MGFLRLLTTPALHHVTVPQELPSLLFSAAFTQCIWHLAISSAPRRNSHLLLSEEPSSAGFPNHSTISHLFPDLVLYAC